MEQLGEDEDEEWTSNAMPTEGSTDSSYEEDEDKPNNNNSTGEEHNNKVKREEYNVEKKIQFEPSAVEFDEKSDWTPCMYFSL